MFGYVGPVRTRRTLGPPVIAFLIMAGVHTATTDRVQEWCSTVGLLLLAIGAALACVRAARRTQRRLRRGWATLALACGCWAGGQVVRTVTESFLSQPPRYPSPADAGYLGFTVVALIAFGWLTPPASRTQLARRLLDSLTVGAAFLLVEWLLEFRQVASRSGSLLDITVGFAYPVGHVVLLAVAGLTITQSRPRPAGWPYLAAAASAILYADGTFAFLATTTTQRSGGWPDWGWWAAFCLIGAAAGRVRPGSPPDTTHPDATQPHTTQPHTTQSDTTQPGPRPESSSLPGCATLVAAVLTVLVAYEADERLDTTAVVLTGVLGLLVLVRRFVGRHENRRLLRALLARDVQLRLLAFYDPLTGLANRRRFLDRLEHTLERAAALSRPVSVVFCDVDGLKAVNDSLGHATGDRLLVTVAQRFSAVLGDGGADGDGGTARDRLARLGGDEFAVIVEPTGPDRRSVETVTRALLATLDEPFVLADRTVAVSASIGAVTTDPRRRPETAIALLHRADIAMCRFKASGRDSEARAQAGDHPAGRAGSTGPGRSDELADALAVALDRRDVRAVYQPVVDTITGRISALEVLARWTHEGRVIGPDVFVPIAERNGLSSALTTLMLDRACQQLGAWTRQLGHQRLRVAVNVSPSDLLDADLPLRVARHLERWGLAHEQLALEVTETEMWRPDEVLDLLYALRASGVRIAIDDFGTGHSSLSRLSSLPLDTLKIDRIFVTDIDHDDARLRFLSGLMAFAHHLGLRTVAEGVERPGQLLALRELRCDLVQGYLTGRPSAPEVLTPLILADATLLPFALQPS